MAWAGKEITYTDFDWDEAKEIGVGAIARVFLCKYLKDGLLYAIKTVGKSDLIQANKVEAIVKEKDILQRLHKVPYIGTLLCTFQTDEELFFVMEYLDAGNLEMLCLKSAVPEDVLVQITGMIIEGMIEIHKLGWAHRDLKPQNICFRNDGSLGILDFDTAMPDTSNPVSMSATKSIHEQTEKDKRKYSVSEVQDVRRKTQQFVGTAQYISPEMLDSCSYSYASDIWGLGCIVYQMATGRPPFYAESQFEIFRQVVKCRVDFDAIKSPVIKDFCEKTLRTDPTTRLGVNNSYPEDLKAHDLFKNYTWGEPNLELVKTYNPGENAEYIKNMVGCKEDYGFDNWLAKNTTGLENYEPPFIPPAVPTVLLQGGTDDTMDIIDDVSHKIGETFQPFNFGHPEH
eukprot:TRINITY_DN7158_c0_g1_i1.p2 TRINITY_DN7158_c0_g1~~TRINITY_DN7158_c0_g1_i1.p2  ORF type:complete len:399 (+),score=63.82 TRINITY_DN7158_c0_g1_i1:50-1246(+)